ncbi:hypothetical protein CsatB_015717 [Cannabis sativa]
MKEKCDVVAPIWILFDDMLLEVFLRIFDLKCIMECAFVCKRWMSVISSSKSSFWRKFNHFHRQNRLNNSSFTPFTLLFRTNMRFKSQIPPSLKNNIFSFEFFSEGSKIFDYGQKPALDFLPWRGDKWRAYIWSSFDDLLLVERSPTRVYICNPFTKQYVEIPGSPFGFHELYWYALVVSSDFHNYKVVKISSNENKVRGLINLPWKVQLSIFCSETKLWSTSILNFPVTFNYLLQWRPTVVGSNGIVYLSYINYNINGIIGVNPLSNNSYFINLPPNFLHKFKARIGVVYGKLRVVQLYLSNSGKYVFKSWELIDNDDDEVCIWNLVHYHDKMTIQSNKMSGSSQFNVLALHPDDEDVFFFENRTSDDEVEILQCRILGQNHNEIKYLCHLPPTMNKYIHVIPLSHPPCLLHALNYFKFYKI